VLNPATGQVESEFATASDTEVAEAVARAHDAYGAWRARSLGDRVALVHKVADAYEKRAQELGALITREMGKTLGEAVGEVEFSASIYRYYADNAEALLADQPIPCDDGEAYIRKDPMGVLLGIMPWNYPYYQVARFAAPNLLVGNTILLKHAAQCPESALAMEEIFRSAGIPQGVYLNLFASHDQLTSVIADPRVRGVSVTGSERAGAAVASEAGRHLKKVVLELGGSDPYVVLDTDDLPTVVQKCVDARMGNGGQACNAGKRFIVADTLYDDFVEQFTATVASYRTGDPFDPETSYGPLSSETALRDLAEIVDDAVAKGATVRTGATRLPGPGFFYAPTVLTDVTPEMRAFHEELFGPVAVVYKVPDVDAAVELANDTPFGLGAAVFHSDRTVAVDVARRIDTGMVWINDSEDGGPELPFGGTKNSGVGREMGPLGIEEFVNKKLVHLPPAS
jgi:succinate-semialdehyde dehydrogenase/glutarate-semialdehyde dehydrogenase